MSLELSDEEAATLIRELHDIVESDRYPFSPAFGLCEGFLTNFAPSRDGNRSPHRSITRRRLKGGIADAVR
jgi:hypothetical protein